MQKKHFFFAICLLASTFLGANNFSPPIASTTPLTDCNVPAPDNFHVEAIGTTWIGLAWDFQPDAKGGYRIQTFRTSDNALISTKINAWDQLSVTVDGLVSGEEYRCEINSRCEGGSNSPLKAHVGPIRTIIGELIVAGVQGPYSTPLCTIYTAANSPDKPTAGTYCFLASYPAQTPFRISNQEESYDFGVSMLANPTRFQSNVNACGQNSNGFSIEGNATNTCPNYNIDFIIVRKYGTPIAILYVSCVLGGSPYMVCTSIFNGYTIKRYSEMPDRNGNSTPSILPSATASPNPFSNTLDIQLAQPATEKVRLQLFNLSGQMVLERQLEASKQEQFSLPTAGLSPGFYLLRIEADGEVQTLKVVKSE